MQLQDSILVAGYPLGGDSLSITKGIVSRVRSPCNHHAYLDASESSAMLAYSCWCNDNALQEGTENMLPPELYLSVVHGILTGSVWLQVVMTRYAHASNKLLGIQIDAAINPGTAALKLLLRSGHAQLVQSLHECRSSSLLDRSL